MSIAVRGRQTFGQLALQVMSFDLDRTTHEFRVTSDGGTERVTVKDTSDTGQVELIREHLKKEPRKFQRGDFTDPMATHGMEMPGLATLRTSGDKLTITYVATPPGAMLRFSTTDRSVRDAIRRWFEAQLQDHGADAHG